MQPEPLHPPGYEDSAATTQNRIRLYQDANSGEEVEDTDAEVHGSEDAAEHYKEQWRQNKIETNKQQKEIAALQAILKTMMKPANEEESEAAGQDSNWD